jgi:hypothetical protein
METFLILCSLLALFVLWAYLRNRLAGIDSRIADLSRQVHEHGRELALLKKASIQPAPTAQPKPEPARSVAVPAPPAPSLPAVSPPTVAAPRRELPTPSFTMVSPRSTAAAPPRSTEEWETLLGGNWLNKAGVFVLVVGIALALGYSFTRLGPWGRVSISLAASLAMLAGGAVLEPREPYRMFARGLLGGGWAALYVTVFAMHAVDAARVIPSPIVGAVLLLGVAAGMIVNSLRYRSQTVTGVAYFVAFATLAITQAGALPLVALVPLAISLLYVAHRFSWLRLASLGLLATYSVCLLRTGATGPLSEAQVLFAVYWLLFEIFDFLHPEAWLLPLNAAGFLGLSILKWQAAAPDRLWLFLAAAALAYFAGTVARSRTGKWMGSLTVSSALAAAAVFESLHHQWIAAALVAEAELLYLAGIRLRAPYVRWVGNSLFALAVGRLLWSDVASLPANSWAPIAATDAAIFYLNRALCPSDVFFGYAASGLLAVVAGNVVPAPYRAVAWLLMAAGAFAFGWRRHLTDFRFQGYLLAILGLTATAFEPGSLPFAVAAAVSYTGALCALWSSPDRFTNDEHRILRWCASIAATVSTAALVWRVVAAGYLGLAWLGLALILLELGLRGLPRDFRRLALAVAALAALRLWISNILTLQNVGPWPPRLVPLESAVLAYAFAIRARDEEQGKVFAIASSAGTILLLAATGALLPSAIVAPVWAALALAVYFSGTRWNRAALAWQGYFVAGIAFPCYWVLSFFPNQEPLRASQVIGPVPAGAAMIALYYASQALAARGSRARLYFSLLATTLTTALLCAKVSGSMLTVACGIQGLALLASGFPLRDRILRISGLVLLLACILKLFAWDLRHLETLPRIFSFIALGLILVGVSWVYTRFRERVSRYL